MSVEDQLREIGRRRRTEGQMVIVRQELARRQRRESRKRQIKAVIHAVGFLLVTAAAVIILFSL